MGSDVSGGGGITGRPAHGLRLEVVLEPREKGAERAVYTGHLFEPDRDRAVSAVATKAGVEVTLDPHDDELVSLVKALLRAATKAELVAGDPPPRKIVRWRSR